MAIKITKPTVNIGERLSIAERVSLENFKAMDATFSGNVGIRNNDPNLPLTITSNSGANAIAIRARSDDDYGFIQFYNNAGTTLRGQIYNNNGSIGFTTGTDSSAGDDLYIDTSGNVGIGRTSIAQPSSGATTLAIQGTSTTKGGAIQLYSSDDSVAAYIYADNVSGLSINTSTSHPMVFRTAGAERMRIDSSGNVGIGTSPDSWKSAWSVLDIGLGGSLFAQDNNTTGLSNNLYFNGSNWVHKNTGQTVLYQQSEGEHLFYSNASQAAGATFTPSERMRIDASGNLLVGNTGLTSTKLSVYNNGADAARFAVADSAGSSVSFMAGFSDSTTTAYGTLRVNIVSSGDITNSNGTYGTISDEKLKQDIVDAPSQWDDLKAVRFRKYRMKQDVENDPNAPALLGVIAQELQQICPNLVDEYPDRDEKGNNLGTTTKTVKSSILFMKAVKALQEAMDRIETLEAKVAALES